MKRIRLFLSFLVLGAAISACRDKTPDPFTTDVEVNKWIYSEMKTWYYRTDKIPLSPDSSLKPDAFFYSLLYTATPGGDRFSWIQQNVDELKSSLSGATNTSGMEFTVFKQGDSEMFGAILYTLPGSPAAQAGFKRGDFFTGVNGTPLTAQNYRTLLSGSSAKKFTVGVLNAEKKVVPGDREVLVTPVRFQEDPVHFDTVFSIGNKKIAYLVYHQFFPSTDGTDDNRFDKKLETVFTRFREKGANELILDLRYNPGGYTSSATHLASLIGKGVNDKRIFSIKEYNPEITKVLRKEYGDGFFEDKFKTLSQNIGVSLDRVFVLTSKKTASASELLVNGLKPYMGVILVGGQTVGKNVGSVTLSDTKNRTKWGMQPIVSKSFNSQKRSDYAEGFNPDFAAEEGYVLFPYGDSRDPLLARALDHILGTTTTARKAAEAQPAASVATEVLSTVTRKAGNGNMFEQLPE